MALCLSGDEIALKSFVTQLILLQQRYYPVLTLKTRKGWFLPFFWR